jgi:hypothetical protein
MNRRKMGLGILAGLVLATTAVAGCSSNDGAAEEGGTLSVPLVTQGPSGATYRLRDAVFEIRSEYYYYDDVPSAEGGAGGTSSSVITLSSETNPDASSLSVSLERGYYYVSLKPGWRMEKVEGGSATNVEATLLTSATQWAYVAAHSTRWLEYQFGLGDRALWFNGKLNVSIGVYEKPSDLYGESGAPSVAGAGGEAGAPTGVGGSW